MRKFISICCIWTMMSFQIVEVTAQTVCYSTIINGDTLIVQNLPVIKIIGERIFRSEAEKNKYRKLERDIRIVYPYAILTAKLLASYEGILSQTVERKDRKVIFKKIEKELIATYGGDVKKLTKRQGRILIKLVDRETSKSSYEILTEFRGEVTAFVWQSISRIFGHDLKSRYNPKYGDDRIIESVIAII